MLIGRAEKGTREQPENRTVFVWVPSALPSRSAAPGHKPQQAEKEVGEKQLAKGWTPREQPRLPLRKAMRRMVPSRATGV